MLNVGQLYSNMGNIMICMYSLTYALTNDLCQRTWIRFQGMAPVLMENSTMKWWNIVKMKFSIC